MVNQQRQHSCAAYNRALALNPEAGVAIIHLGHLRFQQGRYRAALAHYHLGQAYQHKGDTANARAAYERFLQIWRSADPDVPEILAAQRRLALP